MFPEHISMTADEYKDLMFLLVYKWTKYIEDLRYNIEDLRYIFQTMNYIGSNNQSLKYQSFTSSFCKEIGIRNFLIQTKLSKLLKEFLIQCKNIFKHCLFLKNFLIIIFIIRGTLVGFSSSWIISSRLKNKNIKNKNNGVFMDSWSTTNWSRQWFNAGHSHT